MGSVSLSGFFAQALDFRAFGEVALYVLDSAITSSNDFAQFDLERLARFRSQITLDEFVSFSLYVVHGEREGVIRVPEIRLTVTPAVEAQLNERQREIIAYVLAQGSVTNRWCRARFRVVYNTAYRDLQALVALNLIKPVGSGRSVKYVPQSTQP